MRTPRALLRAFLLLGLGLASAVALVLGSAGETSPASAADLREFDPANIISDPVFFDSGAMSAADVQNFLVQKGANCTGSLCLKNYTMATSSRAPTTYCPGGYQGAASESAASIIYKVAQACGINPQVLLVTLQKEMGFITSRGPTTKMYTRAMGYGCPDNTGGTCASQYEGFQNQLYNASAQFQRYVRNPNNYGYAAGRVNYIRYHPSNDACGRAAVYIQNGATAALYNYTPYVPDGPALAAGYGEGVPNTCSAYGNRNFFSYFTDWFGSTQDSGSGAIHLRYQTAGGEAVLGAPVGAAQCGLAAGGCARAYYNGSIYWSPASGAAVLTGAVLHEYWANGSVTGVLGYPISDSAPITGGAAGAFQGGSIYWSPGTGAHAVTREMLTPWWISGGVSGPLGYPIADSAAITGGRATAFQGGSVYWSKATGGHWLAGPVLQRYWATGVASGPMGFPRSSLSAVPGGQAAAFQGGSIYSSAGTGAHAVEQGLLSRWWATGGVEGPLGFPTESTTAVEGGKVSRFAGGSVYWSQSTGARWLAGAVLTEYTAAGGPARLGFPLADQGPVTGGTAAAFERASIYHSPGTGAHTVFGAVRSSWWARGGISGPLGFPTADVTAVDGPGNSSGWTGSFSGGALYWSSATGGRLVQGDILTAYRAGGGPVQFGFPVADQSPVTGGSAAAFEKVSFYSSPATGAHYTWGTVRSSWWARGGISGPLGFPTADVRRIDLSGGAHGYVSEFSGGSLYWSAATGPKLVQGPILAAYVAAGGPASLGFPVADQGPVTGGTAVALQRASIYASPGTGAHVLSGQVRQAYWAAGAITGPLGFPTSSVQTVVAQGLTGTTATFQGGGVYATASTGAQVLLGTVHTAYVAAGGPASSYGWPTSGTYALAGVPSADFQSGRIPG